MSRIQARPFISDVIESLTTQQKTTLGGLIDGSAAVPTFRSLINPTAYITSADQGVSHIILETQDKRVTGYLIYNATYCVLVGYTKDTQDLSINEIDLATQTMSRVSEPLTILELRFILAGSSTFDPSGLEAEIALKEDSANKSSSIGATPSEVKFPTEKAVADYVQAVVLGAIERSY